MADMSLSPEDSAKVQQWLNSKCIKDTCDKCNSNEWSTGSISFLPTLKKDGDTTNLDIVNGLPVIHMACNNCGYVMFFSAVKMGVLVK